MTLQQWLDQWSSKSPDFQDRLRVALEFLERHYGAERQEKILSEIRCIDLSQPVTLPFISAGTPLVGSKDPRISPYRAAYFTKSGHPLDRLGVAGSGSLRTNPAVVDKVQYRYIVQVSIPRGEALESICSPAADTWSMAGRRVLAAGGGLQYLIPNMNRYLRFIE